MLTISTTFLLLQHCQARGLYHSLPTSKGAFRCDLVYPLLLLGEGVSRYLTFLSQPVEDLVLGLLTPLRQTKLPMMNTTRFEELETSESLLISMR